MSLLKDKTVKNKTVLITGGAKRLGAVFAQTLAEDGWHIALHCNHSVTEANLLAKDLLAFGVNASVFQADLANEAQVKNLVPAVIERMGSLEALVNNASIFEFDDVGTIDYASILKHMAVNLAAPLSLANAMHFAAIKAETARQCCVINILDQKLWNLNPDFLSYTLSKSALQTATTLLAKALAPGTRVCAVAPGLTLNSDDISESKLQALKNNSLLGYGPTAQSVADAVKFLLNNPFVTDSVLCVDAGQHLQKHARDFAFM